MIVVEEHRIKFSGKYSEIPDIDSTHIPSHMEQLVIRYDLNVSCVYTVVIAEGIRSLITLTRRYCITIHDPTKPIMSQANPLTVRNKLLPGLRQPDIDV